MHMFYLMVMDGIWLLAKCKEHMLFSPQILSTSLPSTSSSSKLLEKLLKENSDLMERVTSLSQERATLKHRLTLVEQQLSRTENELAKVTTETENRPITDVTSNSKVRRKHLHLYRDPFVEELFKNLFVKMNHCSVYLL